MFDLSLAGFKWFQRAACRFKCMYVCPCVLCYSAMLIPLAYTHFSRVFILCAAQRTIRHYSNFNCCQSDRAPLNCVKVRKSYDSCQQKLCSPEQRAKRKDQHFTIFRDLWVAWAKNERKASKIINWHFFSSVSLDFGGNFCRVYRIEWQKEEKKKSMGKMRINYCLENELSQMWKLCWLGKIQLKRCDNHIEQFQIVYFFRFYRKMKT